MIEFVKLDDDTSVANAVDLLHNETGATEFACSVSAFLAAGWSGSACRVYLRRGQGTVYPSAHCPRDYVWALPDMKIVALQNENSALKAKVESLEKTIARMKTAIAT